MITEEAFREEINELAQQGTDIDPQPLHFRVFQPKETLMSGLRVVMHHEVEWLKEYDEVADWLSDNKGKGLFLIGPVGVGKTEICMKVIPIIFLRLFKLTISRMSSTDIVTHEKYSTAISTTLMYIVERSRPNKVILTMSMESLLDENVKNGLIRLFGERVEQLPQPQLMTLAMAYSEAEITNERLQYALDIHRADITKMLSDMCAAHLLEASGHGRGTKYHVYTQFGVADYG